MWGGEVVGGWLVRCGFVVVVQISFRVKLKLSNS